MAVAKRQPNDSHAVSDARSAGDWFVLADALAQENNEMSPSHNFTDALLEQRLAELSDAEFDALVTRTRPPRLDPPPEKRATGKQQAAVDALIDYRKNGG